MLDGTHSARVTAKASLIGGTGIYRRSKVLGLVMIAPDSLGARKEGWQIIHTMNDDEL